MTADMLLPRFEFEAPTGVAQAATLLAEAHGEAHVLAGGTDLLVKMKRGILTSRLVISLRRIAGLDGVEATADGGLRLGPLATMTRLARHPALAGGWCAGLADGAASVAGPVIRNRATVGGNIVNARPCADTVPPLVALGARLVLEGPGGARRTADLDGFLTGPGKTRIREGEILTAIEVPPPGAGPSGTAYFKFTRRLAMEVCIAGCGAGLELDGDRRTVRRARLVFTSVAPTPLRIRAAEQVLEGRPADEAAFADAAAAARREARPISDHRAPADFRSDLVEVLARRALRAALERASGRAAR